MRQFTASLVIASAAGIASAGVTNPYSEGFEAGANGWTDIANDALNEVATGGVDGSAYVNTSYSFNGSADGDLAVLFRGNAPGQNASGGAFAGDWLAGGVTPAFGGGRALHLLLRDRPDRRGVSSTTARRQLRQI